MEYISYVEIDHFKGFKNPVRISLKNPAVIIGPNNAGKTTVIQAQLLSTHKMSEFAERVFARNRELNGGRLVLEKGEFYKMIDVLEPQEVSDDVVKILDEIVKTFQ